MFIDPFSKPGKAELRVEASLKNLQPGNNVTKDTTFMRRITGIELLTQEEHEVCIAALFIAGFSGTVTHISVIISGSYWLR